MIIYIAGPITGDFDYRTKFKKAERKLVKKGHIIINPSYLPNGLEEYMGICKAMIEQVDAVYFLDGFEHSEGCKEELKYARKIGKRILYEINPFSLGLI